LTARELAIIATVQPDIGYVFTSPRLLLRALVHRSHAHVIGEDRLASNERLEFLGDSVLGLVVSEDLFRRHLDREEGDLTKMKARLVCGTTLSLVAMELGLGEYVLLSRGEESTGGRERASILADVVEAILGAIYLDGGLGPARAAVDRWILSRREELLNNELLGNNKSLLQEIIQSHLKFAPRYVVRETTGPDHERSFVVEVRLKNTVLGVGMGPNKKSAEQLAAAQALQSIARDQSILFPNGESHD